jgi:hypothetical protein
MKELCHVSQTDEPVTQLSCFRTNLHGKSSEPIFGAAQLGSCLGNACLTLIENWDLQAK